MIWQTNLQDRLSHFGVLAILNTWPKLPFTWKPPAQVASSTLCCRCRNVFRLARSTLDL